MAKQVVKAIPLTSVDSADITAVYQPINPAGLPEACFLLRIINGSTMPVTISYDGTTDNDVVFANSIAQLPAPLNTQPNSRGALFAQGTIVYVKGTAGTGTVGLSGYYQPQY